MDSDLDACQERLGYRFRQPQLLDLALTHASRRSVAERCNERMEFLGDSILGMVIAEFLFREFPDFSEGELTLIKSVVVSTRSLAGVVSRLDLFPFVRLGRGIADKQELPPRVLANIFESIVAAIYLDSDIERARAFILAHLERGVREVLHNRHRKNYKSLLQTFAQKYLSQTPTYRLVGESGPEHGKQFELCAVIGEAEYQAAWGRSKKDAQQQAAQNALIALAQELGPDHPGLVDLELCERDLVG